MVAPAMLAEPWCTGEILLLSPRRLAARAAAERMAALAGEAVGQSIGYATRLDTKRSAGTRILVVTEGIFRKLIHADPELTGISAVLFDEVHERSLDSDAAMAFALDVQGALRPDLRLVAMSATLDGKAFSALMDASVIESEGRAWPLELRYIGRSADRIEDDMARAVRRALGEAEGDVLAFLPGLAEIAHTSDRLEGVDCAIHQLHGSLEPAVQQAALAPSERRKIILATGIAETSLTIDGVRIVIDSGLARRPRYDRAVGMTRLVTERASQAAVAQRAGRAARQGPGTAYRLWEEAATAGFPRFNPPEILEADLSALILETAIWGVIDPLSLRWLDPPPEAAVREAKARLLTLGALDIDGRPTAYGRAIATLPLAPRLAHMLLKSQDKRLAAEVAVLLGERNLGGNDPDLEARLTRWRHDDGRRAAAARALARRWAALVPPEQGTTSVGQVVAIAFPDRVARRRDGDGANWASIGGRGFRLDASSSLARAEWLAVAETQGSAAGARIVSAAPLDSKQVEALFAAQIVTHDLVAFDHHTGTVSARRVRRLGAVTLSTGPIDAGPQAVARALLEGVRTHGLDQLPRADALQARAAFAGVTLDDAMLMARLDEWLPPLLTGKRRLSDIAPAALAGAWVNLLDWADRQRLDARAPRTYTSPAGTVHAIDYAAPAGPTVELRVQAVFGLSDHPVIGDGTRLVLSLTSPGGKPIQTTRDLPGFWAGSWHDVAKEMRGRYPRHAWPDDPASARASLRTKNALAREG